MKPSNKEIRNVFNSAAPRYDSVTSSYAIRRRVEFFIEHAKGKCLEVGAGTGVISRALFEAGHEIASTDISLNMVEEMKKKDLDAVVCDAEKLPFSDASFDTVLASEMIYYLDHPETFLQEAWRVLKPGGTLLLSSANNRVARFYDLLRAVLRPFGLGGTYFDDPVHAFYSEDELRHLVERAGFSAIQTKKILVLPISFFDGINRILERTPLRHAGAFVLLSARK
ncbi:MAG: ubiquinone biosynthesis protein UbiE [Parcubacteria group bacterium Gr01-1014_70]|nr:MAG: ubiquinone biosynthesis protein UbiE [Parcubacteria group bacterium Gr01-1014_70]